MTDDTSAWPPSLWAETATPAPVCAPLAGDQQVDIAVVGAGFTGLSAALHLAEVGHAVRVLEAVQPGWGASGRNGGQVNPGWKLLPKEIETLHGRQQGRRINAMAHAACDLVFDLIDRHGIDCDAERPGYVQGAQSRRGITFLENWARQWTARGAPVELLSRRETGELLGTEIYLRALLDRRGGNIQPLSYARGLARAAMAAGAEIHADSPALSLRRDAGGWKLETSNGSLRAQQVLICTNGYTGSLWPGLAAVVVPVPSFVAASEPLDDTRRAAILPGRHAVSETRRVQVYYRMDADGRFVIGGRGHLFDAAEMGEVAHVHAEACRLYPTLAGVKWQFHWGGYTAMTLSHTPKLMALAPGLHAGMGYNGRGIAMATMMGKQLAMAVAGERPDMPVESLSRVPLHGLRQVAISFRLIAGTFLDRCEHLTERRGGMRLLKEE
ncbi:MAG: FAD-binding oxidoreductase [Gammaproteobacteria bacterium]|nr:MAG: FAD-binding oxidoreductase [Gammaproteobacteria bacterium]